MTFGDIRPTLQPKWFQGIKDPSKVILVIAGVHGSEQSGIEVVQKLMQMLSDSPPNVSVKVYPVLFAANYGKAQENLAGRKNKSDIVRTGDTGAVGRNTLLKGGKDHFDPNRQFPEVAGQGAKHVSKHIHYDSKGIPRAAINNGIIEDENVKLINDIESLQNLIRIISVHGIYPPRDKTGIIPVITQALRHEKALAGIFVDPPTPVGRDVTNSPEWADPAQGLYWTHYNATNDDQLAIDTARRIRIKQDSYYGAHGLTRDLSNDWVVGNWLDEKYPDSIYPVSKTSRDPGVSLGEWASREVEDAPRRDAIPVFTCEPRRYYPSSIFLPLFKAGESDSERKDNERILNEYTERVEELSAFASAINEVLING